MPRNPLHWQGKRRSMNSRARRPRQRRACRPQQLLVVPLFLASAVTALALSLAFCEAESARHGHAKARSEAGRFKSERPMASRRPSTADADADRRSRPGRPWQYHVEGSSARSTRRGHSEPFGSRPARGLQRGGGENAAATAPVARSDVSGHGIRGRTGRAATAFVPSSGWRFAMHRREEQAASRDSPRASTAPQQRWPQSSSTPSSDVRKSRYHASGGRNTRHPSPLAPPWVRGISSSGFLDGGGPRRVAGLSWLPTGSASTHHQASLGGALRMRALDGEGRDPAAASSASRPPLLITIGPQCAGKTTLLRAIAGGTGSAAGVVDIAIDDHPSVRGAWYYCCEA